MLKLAVLVSGGGTNLQAIIDQIDIGIITNTEIKIVISNNKSAFALKRAAKHNIDAVCVSPKDFESRAAFHEALLAAVDSADVDLIVLAGCLVILPDTMIQKYVNRIINIHPSLIPAFCGTGFYGLRVHEEVIKYGVKITGATCHFVDDGTDTGPIILQKPVEVREDDTPRTLQQRVMEQGEWVILPEAINLIANNKITVIDRKVIIRK